MEFIVRGFANVVDDAEKHCALLIVGDGPEKDRLSQLASDLGISDRVAFLGLRRDVREVLFESDLLVHASLAETCTYAITESMAVGIPAVVTEAGAAHEQIASGESGWVVARDDAEGFAKHLLELADDAPLRHRLGTEARKRFEQSFRIEQSAEAFHETYRQLAADRDASQTVAST
jgi:glycosyltransferase involved in cell wall biosynthesis